MGQSTDHLNPKMKWLNKKMTTVYIFTHVEIVNKLRTYTKRVEASGLGKTRIYYLDNDGGEKLKVCKNVFKKVF